jgi:hypothetical protein
VTLVISEFVFSFNTRGEETEFKFGGSYIDKKSANNKVNKMINKGIRVLSFFIHTSTMSYDVYEKDFKYMYGQAARQIRVTNIIPLAKEINSMFI